MSVNYYSKVGVKTYLEILESIPTLSLHPLHSYTRGKVVALFPRCVVITDVWCGSVSSVYPAECCARAFSD